MSKTKKAFDLQFKCADCGKKPEEKQQGDFRLVNATCKCGGRMILDEEKTKIDD
jgi:DNA-directed RNA polymerase subunit RPC12/RpoP